MCEAAVQLMLWADRIALGFLELLAVALLLFVAINYLTSAFSVTPDKVYGLFIASACLMILPFWLVLRMAERRWTRRQ